MLLSTKVKLFFGAFVLLSVSGVAGTTLILSKQAAASTEINLAGRQRMLTQKMTKEAFVIATALNQGDVKRADQNREGLKKTLALFDRTLQALLHGGTTLGGSGQDVKLPGATTEAQRQALEQGNTLWKTLQPGLTGLAEGMDPNSPEGKQALEGVLANNIALLKLMNQATSAFKASSDAKTGYLRIMQLVMIVITIVIATMGTILFKTALFRPLKALSDDLYEISEGSGDLTLRATHLGHDEIGTVGQSFNHLIQKLQALVTATKGIAQELSQSTSDICEATEGINQKIQSQHEHLSGAAMAAKSFVDGSERMAQRGRDASETTLRAKAKADEGNEEAQTSVQLMQKIVMGGEQSVQAMHCLAEQTASIGTLIETIDDIADQTNLLALNAAIEAARAGEQGRGFAVVADEVRKLADRTTTATAEVTDAITSIQTESNRTTELLEVGLQDVQQGVAAAEASGATLLSILSNTGEVSEAMTNLSTFAEEQAQEALQIFDAMENVSEISSTSAKEVDQATYTINQISKKSAQLEEMLIRFNLNAPDRRINEGSVPPDIQNKRVNITQAAKALLKASR